MARHMRSSTPCTSSSAMAQVHTPHHNSLSLSRLRRKQSGKSLKSFAQAQQVSRQSSLERERARFFICFFSPADLHSLFTLLQSPLSLLSLGVCHSAIAHRLSGASKRFRPREELRAFSSAEKKAQLQSHGGWKAAAARKARESHGDRVAAAPLRVGHCRFLGGATATTPRLLPASKETRQAASPPGIPLPAPFLCRLVLLSSLGAWVLASSPRKEPPVFFLSGVSWTACFLAAFVLLCLLICS